MVNFLTRSGRIQPNYKEEPIELNETSSVQEELQAVQQEEECLPQFYNGHWLYSRLYPLFGFLMIFGKISAGSSFFHWTPFSGMNSDQAKSQQFGIGLIFWSLNPYFLMPYFSNRNLTRDDKDTRVSSVFIIGSILNILGTVVFAIYSHEFNEDDQIFDLFFGREDKSYRTLFIAADILCDFGIAIIYGNYDIVSYNPKKNNDRYKLGSYTGYIRDNPHSRNRLDIATSSCFQIVIRNKGRTAVKFGDPACVDPTFRSVTSFKIERIVTRTKHFFFFFPYKSTDYIDFTVRIMKTIPPGGDITFIPDTHSTRGAYRIKGLRAFCQDRGDVVETRIILPYDRFPFLTRVELYTRVTDRRSKYEEEPGTRQISISSEGNSS